MCIHETESFVKLGRLAVIKEFRKAGIAKLLIDTALAVSCVNIHTIYCLTTIPTELESMSHNGLSMDFQRSGACSCANRRPESMEEVWV